MEGDVTVREIMTREFVGVSESDGVGAAVELMLEEATPGVVVLRGSDPVGMLTAEDALAAFADGIDPGETSVGDAMSGTVPSVEPGALAVEAAGTMAAAGTGSLLVEAAGELVGVVSERDLVRATASMSDVADPSTPTAGETPAGTAGTAAAEGATQAGADPEYTSQGLCEICGALVPDLREFNGQLVCDDCRDV